MSMKTLSAVIAMALLPALSAPVQAADTYAHIKCALVTQAGEGKIVTSIVAQNLADAVGDNLLANGTFQADGRTLEPVAKIIECTKSGWPFSSVDALQIESQCIDCQVP